MNTSDLKNALLEELDFINAPDFQSAVFWPNDRSIPHVSSAYFVQGKPVVYFSQFEEVDTEALARLYRSVWSQGKAPLLYVISRQDIWCSMAMRVRRPGIIQMRYFPMMKRIVTGCCVTYNPSTILRLHARRLQISSEITSASY